MFNRGAFNLIKFSVTETTPEIVTAGVVGPFNLIDFNKAVSSIYINDFARTGVYSFKTSKE